MPENDIDFFNKKGAPKTKQKSASVVKFSSNYGPQIKV